MAEDGGPFSPNDAPGTEAGHDHELDGVAADVGRESGDATEGLNDDDGEGVEAEDDFGSDFAGGFGMGASADGTSGAQDEGENGLEREEDDDEGVGPQALAEFLH